MRKIIICLILCLSSNLGAVRLYYCFNKNTEEVTVSRLDKNPITYRSFVHDVDGSNHGIVTIHPLMDVHGIGMWENRRDAPEYYPIVRIDDNTFAGCSWITWINIPASIKTIGRNVFWGCKNLNEIHVDANNPYFTSVDGVLYNKDMTMLIKFPAGKDARSFTVPETVKEIAEDAFEGVEMDKVISHETGNPNFDETINYQYNNARAYVGETLYLAPLTGSNSRAGIGIKHREYYPNFMDFDKYDDDLGHSATPNQYKFDAFDYRDYCISGTHKRHLEGHRFYVDDVVQIYVDKEIIPEEKYEYMWVLYLTDLYTGDRVKYIYDGEDFDSYIDFNNFPFVVERHYNYLRSLIGTKLVYATSGREIFISETYVPPYRSTYTTDINTNEPINYSSPYVKWTIKDVGFDLYNSALYFVVTNGRNTTKVIYDNPYCTHHPEYNVGVRVFPEKQWERLVRRYGEKHMEAIMQSIVLDDMTTEELYLVGGRYVAKGLYKEENKSAVETIGESVVKSTKETFKGIKAVGKSLLGL